MSKLAAVKRLQRFFFNMLALILLAKLSIAFNLTKGVYKFGYAIPGNEEGHLKRSLISDSTDNPEYYEPTEVELQQGVAFAAPQYWGVHVRRSKSLRVAFIGGSQTSKYGWYMRSFIDSMKASVESLGWSVAVYNESITETIRRVNSSVFFALNPSVWPNVVAIEPCLYCELPYQNPCSIQIDNMIRVINHKYKMKSLDPPYYFFLELFKASNMYYDLANDMKSSDRVAFPVNASKTLEISDSGDRRQLSRGAPYALFMFDLARYYGLPVLSVTDVLYPSYIRFYITHSNNQLWPYSYDGVHMSMRGCKLIAENILKPFFLEQMKPRDSDKLYEEALPFSPYPVDLRQFSSNQYKSFNSESFLELESEANLLRKRGMRSLISDSTDNPEFYEPTEVELQQGVAFAAPPYWGVHVRRSKSLRVAFIGGSQTADERMSYVNDFRELMNTSVQSMGWSLDVYNEGKPGQRPASRFFNFLKLNSTKWPNVICIEPTLNCGDGSHAPCSYMIDNVRYFINRHYKGKNLHPPYYFFLEFFKPSHTYYGMKNELKTNDLISHPINFSKALEISDFNGDSQFGKDVHKLWLTRGAPYAPCVMDFARFYGMPVLSVTDVLYPSWIRFFLTHPDNQRWPYTIDGLHCSSKGVQLAAKHILKPFFLEQMKPRDSDKLYEEALPFSPYSVDMLMFPSNQYKNIHIVGTYSVSDTNRVDGNSSEWLIQSFRNHDDQSHKCYGTNSSTQSPSGLKVEASDIYCHGDHCRVKFDYLHSWDTSYIAAATCDLYALDKKTNERIQMVDSVSILPNKCGQNNKDSVTGTYICPHVLTFKSVSVGFEHFSIDCRSKEMGKLACIGSYEVFFHGVES